MLEVEWKTSHYHSDGRRRSKPKPSQLHGWLVKWRATFSGNEELRREGIREIREAKAARKFAAQRKAKRKGTYESSGGLSLFGLGKKQSSRPSVAKRTSSQRSATKDSNLHRSASTRTHPSRQTSMNKPPSRQGTMNKPPSRQGSMNRPPPVRRSSTRNPPSRRPSTRSNAPNGGLTRRDTTQSRSSRK